MNSQRTKMHVCVLNIRICWTTGVVHFQAKYTFHSPALLRLWGRPNFLISSGHREQIFLGVKWPDHKAEYCPYLMPRLKCMKYYITPSVCNNVVVYKYKDCDEFEDTNQMNQLL
jgi:hypothetical protein